MNHLAPRLITPPVLPLLTLAEVKAQCRIDHAEDDTYLESLVLAATSHLDGYTGTLGVALCPQTWAQSFRFWQVEFVLPVWPVKSLTHVKYFDTAGVEQILSPDLYRVFAGDGPHVILNRGPLCSRQDRPDAITITWVAGHNIVPQAIRHAAAMLVAHWYSEREAVNPGSSVSELPFAVNALLAPYRKVRF